jgi:cytochrome c
VPGAGDQLTLKVMIGSNPYASHWTSKANALAMPPNAVAIDHADARQIVAWILALDTQRQAASPER